MSDPFEIKPSTIARLEKHARPFVDTFDDVLNRILDAYELTEPKPQREMPADTEVKNFNPGTPPNLTHTKVLSITYNGERFPREKTNWNSLLVEAAILARNKIKSDD